MVVKLVIYFFLVAEKAEIAHLLLLPLGHRNVEFGPNKQKMRGETQKQGQKNKHPSEPEP